MHVVVDEVFEVDDEGRGGDLWGGQLVDEGEFEEVVEAMGAVVAA